MRTSTSLTGGPVSIMARQNEEVESKFMVQALMKFTGPEKPIIVEITRAMDVKVIVEISYIDDNFPPPRQATPLKHRRRRKPSCGLPQ